MTRVCNLQPLEIPSHKIAQRGGDNSDSNKSKNSNFIRSNSAPRLQGQEGSNSVNSHAVIHNPAIISSQNQGPQPAIPIEVVRDTSNNLLQNNTHAARVLKALVQEQLFRLPEEVVMVAAATALVVTSHLLFAANILISPTLMGAATISKARGTGELAKEIGASPLARVLWGRIADEVAQGQLRLTTMRSLAFAPLIGPFRLTLEATNTITDDLFHRASAWFAPDSNAASHR